MNSPTLRSFVLFVLTLAAVRDCTAQTVLDSPTASPLTPRQQAWQTANLGGRMALAEEIGEEGGRAFAKAKGWKPVYDGKSWSMVYGPDQVYRDGDGKVHMVEAKGGNSPLAKGYGHAQGTSEWAVESAKRVLKNPTATAAERRGAEAVVEAAARGKLQVHVVRTPHTAGEPRLPRLEQTAECSAKATDLARQTLPPAARAVAKAGQTASRTAVADAARATTRSSGWVPGTARVLVPAGIALDAGLRVSDGIATERKFAAGQISERDRIIDHSRNAAGMAGGMAGAWAGAEGGAAGGAVVGSFICPGLGTAVGGFVGGLAGGVGGYFLGDAVASAGAEAAVRATW